MGMNIMRMKGRAKMMRTIKVTGKGKIAVKPDKIRLYVNKEELCKEYEDTLRRSTEDTELLKDLFEKLGFQRKDLKTVYFNVDTEYESYQDRDKSWKRRFKGYKYNHHMKIEFGYYLHRTGITKHNHFICSITNPMKLINLAFNVLILLMRFLFRITEHKYKFVCSILIPILIPRRDISIATGINY